MTALLHTLVYAWNPRFCHENILSIPRWKAPNKDKDIKKAFKKLYPDAKVACDVMIEFSEFAFSQNLYAIDALQDKKAMPSVN
eukprot:Gb_15198 [translate_table: standard]